MALPSFPRPPLEPLPGPGRRADERCEVLALLVVLVVRGSVVEGAAAGCVPGVGAGLPTVGAGATVVTEVVGGSVDAGGRPSGWGRVVDAPVPAAVVVLAAVGGAGSGALVGGVLVDGSVGGGAVVGTTDFEGTVVGGLVVGLVVEGLVFGAIVVVGTGADGAVITGAVVGGSLGDGAVVTAVTVGDGVLTGGRTVVGGAGEVVVIAGWTVDGGAGRVVVVVGFLARAGGSVVVVVRAPIFSRAAFRAASTRAA
jgi:hypothetical protein